MAELLAYLQGRVLPLAQAALAWDDRGFVSGATVTDLVRTYGQRPFRLAEHVARFRQSCRLCRVPLEPSDAELIATAESLLTRQFEANGSSKDLALVLFATPGPIPGYLGEGVATTPARPTLGMHVLPLPHERIARYAREGARLAVPATRHCSAATLPPHAKMRSRMFWWIAEGEARDIDPAATALLLDSEGQLTETAAANFLVARQGRVISPPKSSILPGISLEVVEELCRDLRIPFEENFLRLEDGLEADEAFLAGTLIGLAGVSAIQNQAFPCPGPITAALRAAWARKVERPGEGS